MLSASHVFITVSSTSNILMAFLLVEHIFVHHIVKKIVKKALVKCPLAFVSEV